MEKIGSCKNSEEKKVLVDCYFMVLAGNRKKSAGKRI